MAPGTVFGVVALCTALCLLHVSNGAVVAPGNSTEAPGNSTEAPTNQTDGPAIDVGGGHQPNSSVCYEYLDCYDNLPPFNNAENELPQSPEYVNSTFMLYTRDNPGDHEFEVITYKNDSSVNDSRFDASRMTRVIVHGFDNSGFEPWVQQMKDAFLQIEDSNVIVVDWHRGAVMPLYPQAVANTRLIGRQLRLLLQNLQREAGLQFDRVHMIGHSLGAHTSGYTGRDLKGQLYRITAMDPAGPFFDKFAAVLDLDKTDAKFVDVVHSNGKPLEAGGAGLYRQIGHVDFYVNGGKGQPGCRDGISALLDIFQGSSLGEAVACSHSRAHEVFTESITSDCPFTSYPCTSFDDFLKGRCLECGDTGCTEMGLHADDHKARGTMFLMTKDKAPYCGFHYSVTIKTPTRTRSTSGQLSVRLTGNWGTTEFVPVTEEKESLAAGSEYGGTLVASTEVGRIHSLSIRYDKAAGYMWGLFGGGRNTVAVDTVYVKSGEGGQVYKFCLQGQQLTHATAVTLTTGGGDQC